MNKKLRTIIVDDELDSLKVLELELKKHCPEIEVIGIFKSAKEAKIKINESEFELLILDIEMPYMNGFQLLQEVENKNYKIVFLTAYEQYAIKAIKVSAFDYLLKPLNTGELKTMIHKVLNESPSSKNVQQDFLIEQFNQIKENNLPNKIAIETFSGIDLIDLSKIVMCSANDNYSFLIMEDDKKIHSSRNISYLEDLICSYHFYRIHRSHIINLKKINKYHKTDGGYVIMENGSRINVSRNKKQDFLNLIQRRG